MNRRGLSGQEELPDVLCLSRAREGIDEGEDRYDHEQAGDQDHEQSIMKLGGDHRTTLARKVHSMGD